MGQSILRAVVGQAYRETLKQSASVSATTIRRYRDNIDGVLEEMLVQHGRSEGWAA